MTQIYTVTEDRLSEAVAHRLLEETGGRLTVGVSMGRQGFGYIRRKLPELIILSQHVPILILVDLDQKPCAPELLMDWFGNLQRPEPLVFRIVPREIEAWLLADSFAFVSYFGVPMPQLALNPEQLPDPKRELLRLVNRYSTKAIKQDIVARHGGNLNQGLGYNNRLIEFVGNHWSPARAELKATGLAKARQRISELSFVHN